MKHMELSPWGNILVVDYDDIDNEVTIFENVHNEIIGKHATWRTFRVTRPISPWMNEDIKNLLNNKDRCTV